MRNFRDTFETHKQSFISTFSNCVTVPLKTYDTIGRNSLTFPVLFIIGNYTKVRFKSKTSSCYFLSSRGQKIKNITKIPQTRLFLFTFYGVSRTKTDSHNKYII